ncbi:MAG: hypothetical protein RL336_1732 [Pseudomonadota bacterium]|jgi:hypothetical protein
MQDQIPENQRPYEPGYFSAKPNKFVLFMRTFLPWQLVRFAALNVKIMRLLMKGH